MPLSNDEPEIQRKTIPDWLFYMVAVPGLLFFLYPITFIIAIALYATLDNIFAVGRSTGVNFIFSVFVWGLPSFAVLLIGIKYRTHRYGKVFLFAGIIATIYLLFLFIKPSKFVV